MVRKEIVLELSQILKDKMIRKWEGKEAIKQMKNKNYAHWKQMEWIGFYFEFLCQSCFKDKMEYHKISYGRTSFDGFLEVPFDFKAHALNTESHQVIINDTEATVKAIDKYGSVVVIMALGEVKYNDEDRSFQKWHEAIKGGKSRYELERIKRGALSRLRKTEFDLNEIMFIKINKKTLEKSGSFQKNFRNADGSLRRSKVLLDLERLDDEEVLHRIEFKK